MLKKLLSILLFMAVFVPFSLAQTGGIEGTVTNSKTGEIVPGANVLLTEISRGSATDAEGQYSITGVPVGTYTLRVSFIGYNTYTQQVKISANETIERNVQLKPSAVGLDEVVVTGYGNVDETEFTGSVSQVSSEDIESIPVTSITQSLQGKSTGLQISSVSGTPGSVQDVNIRGISSINASNDPLYVIDGVPVTSGEIQASGATSSLGLLASLNSGNIASISVLKGAAATAQYGARGSNGVIVITTKEGSSQETNYSFSIQRGTSQRAVDGPETLTASQWDELYREARVNAGLAPSMSAASSPWDGTTNTNWGDVATDDNAVTEEYNISASGGSENSTYYASVNYMKQEGLNKTTGLKRVNARLNYSYDFSENIKLSNKLTGSYVNQNGMLEGAAYFGNPAMAKYFMLPIDKVYNSDGTYNLDLSNQVYHPLYILENNINRKRTDRVLNNTTLEIDIMNNLKFTSRLGLDYVVNEEKYYDNPVHGDAAVENGTIFDYYTRNFNWVLQNRLDYNWQVTQDHQVNFKLLQEAQQNKYYTIQTGGQNVASTGLTNVASTGTPTYAYSYSDDWTTLGFMGSAKYGYQDKIFVDGTYRYEGNSRFAPGNRWGSFYSVGASYILSREEFLQDLDWLTFLKVRGSYGLTGNASIGLNEYQSFLSYGGSYNGQAAVFPSQLGNQQLTWEKATSYEGSLSFELFSRVNGEVTYFHKKSNDLLYDVPLSYTTGHQERRGNVGSLYNQGIEGTLSIDVIQADDYSWNVGGNITLVENKITELPEYASGENIIITGSYKHTAVEGYRIGMWHMPKWAGVDPQTGQPLWYKNGKGGATTSDYSQAKAAYQGASAMPTTYGSLNTRVNVKGFYAEASLYYSFGNKVYDVWADYMTSDGQFIGFFNQYRSQYKNRWQEPGDQADNPQLIWGGNNQSNSLSTRYLYDGDYLRLQTLRFGYNVPNSLLNNLNAGVTSASIYFVGRNLWTYAYDEDLKYDPEVNDSGYLDFYAAPLETYTVGIKANF